MKVNFRLTQSVFNTIVSRTRMKGKALDAAREVLVLGLTPARAAERHGITRQRVSACVTRLVNNAVNEMGACPCCGQKLKVSDA